MISDSDFETAEFDDILAAAERELGDAKDCEARIVHTRPLNNRPNRVTIHDARD